MLQNKNINWGYVLTAIVATLLLVRILPFLLPALLLGLSVFILGIIGLVVYNYLQKNNADSAADNEINARIQACELQKEKIQAEMSDIRNEIQRLEKEINSPDISRKNKLELEKQRDDFKNEYRLRKLKLDFYKTCITKLRKMKHNQRIKREIEERQEKLRLLKENRYEELAEMESLRSDVEMDVFYLNTIDDLSSQMLKSQTSENTLQLQKELEKMTRELDEL